MSDAIIVLAGGVNPDGSLPDLPKHRVQEGVRLFNEGVASKLIMSGEYGFWLDWKNEIPSNSEAEAMAEYAHSLGVEIKNVIPEEESKDTLGNAYFTKVNILEPKQWKDVVVVTSDFHLERTKYIFDLVLGPDYKIMYVSTETGLSAEKVEELAKQEEKTIEVLRDFVGHDIIPGDTDSIARVLFSKHPGYSDNPEYSYEKLFHLLDRTTQKSSNVVPDR